MKTLIGSKHLIKNFISGISTVLDIYPGTNYQKFIPESSDMERLKLIWSAVEEDLEAANNKLMSGDSKFKLDCSK